MKFLLLKNQEYQRYLLTILFLLLSGMGSYGQITATVYGLIKDSQHAQAIKVLEEQLSAFPDNRAGLSLLGYCHYYQGDYQIAASIYERLIQLQPNESKYQMYYVQSLYKASMIEIADEASMGIGGNKQQIDNLQACIKYEQGDITGSRIIWEENADENMDAIINLACCFFKEGNFGEAYAKFTQVQTIGGFQPKIAYNRAVCLYQMKRFGQALKLLDEIIQHGVREHPELGVGSYMEGMELCSVGNSASLKESHLVEAFNLKATVEYKSGNIEGAKATMIDIPPRAEEELDPVTLHNQALMNMDIDPSSGFRKLNFLLQNLKITRFWFAA